MNTVMVTPAAVAPAKGEGADALIEVRVDAIRYAARDTNIYEFTRTDGKALPPYAPGAHIDLHLPNGLVRQYSLIEAEPDPARYTIAVKRDPASRGGHGRQMVKREKVKPVGTAPIFVQLPEKPEEKK